MKKFIKTAAVVAADDPNDAVMDAIGKLKDDFDYILAGLEKLARSGANASQDAMAIIENLNADLDRHTAEIASKITE